MEGLTKAMLMLIGIGALIYFLADEAYFDKIAIDPEAEVVTSSIDFLRGSQKAVESPNEKESYSEKFSELNRKKEELAVQEAELKAAQEALKDKKAAIALREEKVRQEEEQNIIDRAELEQQLDELDTLKANLLKEKEVLDQMAAELENRTQALTNEKIRLEGLDRQIREEANRLDKLIIASYLVITGGALLTLIVNVTSLIFYRRKSQSGMEPENLSDLLYQIPSYRQYIIHEARKKEMENNTRDVSKRP